MKSLSAGNVFSSSLLARGLQMFLGVVFIYASWHKILDPSGFAKVLYGYDLFPSALINIFAIWTPFLELLAGACLVFGIMPRGGLVIINGLLVLFILVIGINLMRGHEFDCGCFSLSETSSKGSNVELLVRDLLLLSLGLSLWFRRMRQRA